ncbi:PREDICTED: WD repeat-containing protein 36 [Nicrophorus vespilloides]|uniref:WD repeat-containing protein 36 n=1 Tax=Nicrophorus vespilloides TaxID=110193 RepID=A0ABM1MJX3_NICVS|nr:PREDICTED: WD repeat-containing protein 36 [Nicrophorus vespilloides]
MYKGSKIFVPSRSLGNVSNHIPVVVKYVSNGEIFITSVGKLFHVYNNKLRLIQVSQLHPEDITCLAFSKFLTYSAAGNNIYCWIGGATLKHILKKHERAVHLMIPFGDSLISIDEDSKLIVWNVQTAEIFLELDFGNDQFKITAAFHPSTYKNKILLGSNQGALQLWNINTSTLIYTFAGWDSAVTCLEQAPAVDVAAIGLANGKIILHNLKLDITIMEFTQDWGLVTSISFRTDGEPIMATGSVAGHIVFWNLDDRKVFSQKLCAHIGPVNNLICLNNQPIVVSNSADNSLKMWIFDMTDGGARLLRTRDGHSVPPTCIRYHGDNGQNILSVSGDSTMRIFNTQTEILNKSLGRASFNRKASKNLKNKGEDPYVMPPIVEFASEVTREKEWDNIAAIHDGLESVTTWSFNKCKMGDLRIKPYKLHDEDRGHATAISLSHCGNFVLIGYNSGYVQRFNVQSGLFRASYGKPKAHKSFVRGVCCDILNQVVMTGGNDGYIKFFSFKDGKNQISKIHLEDPIAFFRTHKESSIVAVVLEDFTINIVDIDNYNVVRKFMGHKSPITDAAFSPDSRWLITASMDCSIKTWNIPTAQLIDQFRTDVPCISLNMSPTGDALVTAHLDHMGVFLWCNKTIYQHVSLKALDLEDEPELVRLPECRGINSEENMTEEEIAEVYKSSEQISSDLITMSGLASSRWQNLLNINIIRSKNKGKALIAKPKAAPFFLPTVQALDFKFDLTQESNSGSKILPAVSLLNLTEFAKLLHKTIESNDFSAVVLKLKTFGPSMIDYEIKSLSPEGGGTVDVMLQFLKLIEFMLKSNKDFELAESYLGVFLKSHGNVIAEEEKLKNYLPNLQSCHQASWNRLQEKLMYTLCVVQSIKTQI